MFIIYHFSFSPLTSDITDPRRRPRPTRNEAAHNPTIGSSTDTRRARLPLRGYASRYWSVPCTPPSTHSHTRTRPFRIPTARAGSALTALSRYKNAIYPHVNPITARYTLITSSLRVPFKLHALAHISQLQLKASLSLHCVTNRGLPFLFEIVVGKTAWNKGRCMINHIAVC